MVHTRQELREETHARVVAAASRLFLERGYRATTVRDVAAAAGVSVGTVMTVGDKDTLLAATFDALIGELQDAPRPAPDAGSADARPDDVVDAVLAVVDPFLTLFATHLDLAREYGAVLMTGRHPGGVFGELGPAFLAQVQAALERSPDGPHDTAAGARTIYLAYLGSLLAWAGQGTPDADAAREALRDVVTFVAHGHPTPGAHA
jgi:AcrR family transcriptional regulator